MKISIQQKGSLTMNHQLVISIITNSNKTRAIQMRLQVNNHPMMEEEFVMVAKYLLHGGIFQQMEKSQGVIVYV